MCIVFSHSCHVTILNFVRSSFFYKGNILISRRTTCRRTPSPQHFPLHTAAHPVGRRHHLHTAGRRRCNRPRRTPPSPHYPPEEATTVGSRRPLRTPCIHAAGRILHNDPCIRIRRTGAARGRTARTVRLLELPIAAPLFSHLIYIFPHEHTHTHTTKEEEEQGFA